MIKVEHVEVCGALAAMRGMRNAMNSWHLNDSYMEEGREIIGENDLGLLLRLTKAGKSHRKALRMMHIQLDVTAPLYWWKDYDTYKVGTVANSCSTMHKIHAKEFVMTDFSHDKLDMEGLVWLRGTIRQLNKYRDAFNADKTNKKAWYNMIQILPSSYNQKRTLDLNYEVALSIVMDRRLHKLDEFRQLVTALLAQVPYLEEIVKATRYE